MTSAIEVRATTKVVKVSLGRVEREGKARKGKERKGGRKAEANRSSDVYVDTPHDDPRMI